MRPLAIALALVAVGAAPRGDAGGVARTRDDRRPLLIVMNEVVDRLWPKLTAPPADEARRVSVKNGLLGIGAYDPAGSASPRGFASPPRDLFPRAGLGNSLNVDPNTGHSYFTNLP
jgi:hypothetical protein